MVKGVLAVGVVLSAVVVSFANAADDKEMQEIASTFAGYEAVYDVTVRQKDTIQSFNNGVENVQLINGCNGFFKTGNLKFGLQHEKGGSLVSEHDIENIELPFRLGYHFKSKHSVNSKPEPSKGGVVGIIGADSYFVQFDDPDRGNIEIQNTVRFPTGLDVELVSGLQLGKEQFTTFAFDPHADYPVQQVKAQRLPDRFLPALFKQDPGFDVLKDKQGWMVDMIYFEVNGNLETAKKPNARIVKDLYENGVSRNIRIIYPKIELIFRLRSIMWLPYQACE